MVNHLKNSFKQILRLLLKRSNPKNLFSNLASEGTLLPEQVDGYVKRYNDPIVGIMFNSILDKLIPIINNEYRILDIGCGTGRYLSAIERSFPEARLFGVDISDQTIYNYTKKVTKAELAVADFCKHNPFPNQKFDVVYSVTVIQYIPIFRIRKFFRNITSNTKTGSVCFIQFPHGKRMVDHITDFNYMRYTPKYIENLFIKMGFCIHQSALLNPQLKKELGHYIIAEKL